MKPSERVLAMIEKVLEQEMASCTIRDTTFKQIAHAVLATAALCIACEIGATTLLRNNPAGPGGTS